MTYWVIAKINDEIYMAADTRVSMAIAHGSSQIASADSKNFGFAKESSFSDHAQKIQFDEYHSENGKRKIYIGICCSGAEAFYDSNGQKHKILDVLRNFLNDSKHLQDAITLKGCTAEKLINSFLEYVGNTFGYKVRQDVKLNNSFGVGFRLQTEDRARSDVAIYNHYLKKICTGDYFEMPLNQSEINAICLKESLGAHPGLMSQTADGRWYFDYRKGLQYINNIHGKFPIDFLENIIGTARASFKQLVGPYINTLIIDNRGFTPNIKISNEGYNSSMLFGHDAPILSPVPRRVVPPNFSISTSVRYEPMHVDGLQRALEVRPDLGSSAASTSLSSFRGRAIGGYSASSSSSPSQSAAPLPAVPRKGSRSGN